MTLILARTSARYALMVSDRKVTLSGAEYDPDANKNLVFGDKNGVVALGYSGMAYIGETPTDQWIAQTLAESIFPEGFHGPGSVPAFMNVHYTDEYIRLRIERLKTSLEAARTVVLAKYRNLWRTQSFDVVITGFEWNKGKVRPLLMALSKPKNSNQFKLFEPKRNWYLPKTSSIWPVRTYAIPGENVTVEKLKAIDAEIATASKDESDKLPIHAESILIKTIQQESKTQNVVGPEVMSILLSPPYIQNPTIHVRYSATSRAEGVLVRGERKTSVPIGFTPWIICHGHIRSPAILTGLTNESRCGPYTVIVEGSSDTGPSVLSSQQRVRLK